MFYKIFDIITIGLPFGVFKVTSGMYYGIDPIVWWGYVDIVFNCVNAAIYLLLKRKLFPTCLLAFLGQQAGKLFKHDPVLTEDTGESLDVLFSFAIVALVIGSGAITRYPADMVFFWNISVVLNVLGAGSIRVFQSLKRYRA